MSYKPRIDELERETTELKKGTLPSTSLSDAGKFVVVNSGGTGYTLVTVPAANGNSF